MTSRLTPLRGQSLCRLTKTRPAFRPVKVARELWLNPESTGEIKTIMISLPAISMYLAAIAEGGAA